ncbi:histidine phosphatase family protein [Mesorhizobium sp. NBSH29]|uniref:histidine phosphatase family protein n=1 Tax=Mesorhizobium sp. NBSH29 TaxID=2654249 RepID=UPI0018965756|nr:histidine phosphatase family protein [Mesorhizobium sp. NBSH29]QPC87001.1 histidine phosphatase family protein [Mesorhizobium sp. NBSH29]
MYPLIYFVRHGETDWNAEGRLQGQADTDINAHGRDQADRNGRRLAELIGRGDGFDFVASPMRRTRETMERVRTAMGVEPSAYRTDARLVEVSFGDWQGSTFAEIEAESPGSPKARRRDKWNFQPPGTSAESYEMLRQRILPWLMEVTQKTVCVTHGGIIRTLFRTVAEMPEREAAILSVPQDRVLKLEGQFLDWL